jgi:hypothetical protein
VPAYELKKTVLDEMRPTVASFLITRYEDEACLD